MSPLLVESTRSLATARQLYAFVCNVFRKSYLLKHGGCSRLDDVGRSDSKAEMMQPPPTTMTKEAIYAPLARQLLDTCSIYP